jgi:hypothetical protein
LEKIGGIDVTRSAPEEIDVRLSSTEAAPLRQRHRGVCNRRSPQ